jgi:hypothetical protein
MAIPIIIANFVQMTGECAIVEWLKNQLRA